MKEPQAFSLPQNLQDLLKKAARLEWITIGYLLTVIILMYLVMGSSQAMKTAWLEDALSILPAISFLVAKQFYDRKADQDFPYGYHRCFDIAHLVGSLALFLMGCYLMFDSSMSLIMAEKPSIGSWYIFGRQVWLGWIMIGVLLYSSLPAMWLGFKKLPLAKKLFNKILYTDAKAQKADYTTGFAAIIGILGVGMGLWWADAAAAVFISFSVLKDGFTNLKDAVLELMDRHPVTLKGEKDQLVSEIANLVSKWDWVKDSGVRFREHGQVYLGEVLVIPDERYKYDLEEARKEILEFHWKLHDVIIMKVQKIPPHFIRT